MSIADLQNGVNQKLPDNVVGAITPAALRDALTLMVNYLGSVSDQLNQAVSTMAKSGDVNAVGSTVNSVMQSLSDLAAAFNTLNTFVMNSKRPAIADVPSMPAISLTLGSLTVLGDSQTATIAAVNKILAALRAKNLIASN